MPILGLLADRGEAPVQTVCGDELIVRAAFGDTPVLDHKYLAGIADSRKAVGNGDYSLAARQLRYGLLNEVLVFWVNAGGRFVKDDNGSVFQYGAGDGDTLLLTAGERAESLAELTVQRYVICFGYGDPLFSRERIDF